ncbi:uncharacterized protein DUF1553 [Prosthecobacter fusiformis]|uniref:Uncharacterized protein DUF1553 n=1 Tax=Prosthecobacter fusiformis TaxID=48464 RepID=A0A4R7RJE0_9BACT|nr:DUF1549 domain-containing protein [Prosthecobacter fusiformis]TDU64267.1 uncharacterized protein DUF1553 [Prosthecobacter fusiformis]
MNRMRHIALLAVLALVTAAQAAPDTQSAAREIDDILKADWKKNNLKGNPELDDNTFIRRIYLDITGRIPTTREVETFMSSQAPDKRAKLIDHLLASEGYVQHTYNYFADVLRAQTNGSQAGLITGAAYTNYLKESLRKNKPYDQIVRDLVAAEGESWDNGAIGYYMRDRGMPLDNMANTARVFLGTRVECAQCHNHPFDKWTQMQFFQMAAFTYPVQTNDYFDDSTRGAQTIMNQRLKDARDKYKIPVVSKKMTDKEKAQVKRDAEKIGKQARLAGEAVRKDNRYIEEALADVRNLKRYTNVSFQDNRKLVLPHDYQYTDAKPKSRVEPATMYGHAAEVKVGETQLQAYARWMTRDNERFNKVIANRLWKRAFGLALIEPLDELMDSTVPMNPELQAHLEKLIVSLDYDMQAFLRILYNTSAYQRQVTREEIAPGIVYHFTGPILRRMSAEQMWDSFVTLINPNPDMPNEPLRETFTNRILAAKKINDSMEALTPEEVLAGAEKTGNLYKKQADRIRVLQAKISEARAKEDKVSADKYRKDLSQLERETRTSVNENLLIPGMKKLATDLGVVPTLLSPGKKGEAVVASASMDMMMMASEGNVSEKIFLPGYDTPKRSAEEEKALRESREAVWKEEAEFYGLPDKQLRDYYRARGEQVRSWVRSAELDSPAPRGHYLREFGQSDRETIENANLEASVPQALAMMNGQLMPQIMHRHSQLMLTVSKAQYPDDKVEAIYKTLLSRKPTAKEKEVWMKAQDGGLVAIEDLIFSLLNTQQFIFIQ